MTPSTRRVVNSTYLSLDGLTERLPDWHFTYHGDDATAVAQADLDASGAVLMGRHTYESFASVWPTQTTQYADRINALPKLVASTTLRDPAWRNTSVIEGDLAAHVAQLKAEAGPDIITYGIGPVARTLIEHGLMDELRIWLHPVLVGKGAPGDLLFRDGFDGAFTLVDHRAMASGVLILTYQSER